jgi:hypothetical protein
MAEHMDPNRSDWSWLQDTYWYVPTENLSALQLDPENNTLTWVVDQTVWHVTGYDNGYFWGVSATLIRQSGEETAQQGPASRPVCFSMLGTITPEGEVHLTFIPSLTSSSRSATIGIGCAVKHQSGWSLEMQMSSGNDTRTAHWAYMVRVQPGDASWESLPGVGISVPQMLQGCQPPQLSGVNKLQ